MPLMTASEAAALTSAAKRLRSSQGIAALQSVVGCIQVEAEAGRRTYLLKGLSPEIAMGSFIAELQLLGYRVRPTTSDDGYPDRSILINW